MKTKNSAWPKIMLAVVLAMLMAVCCVFAACGEGDKTPGGNTDKPGPSIDKNQNITSVYGTYTRFLGYEDLKDAFTTKITSYGTDDSNLFENDQLVLFHSDVSRHEGNKYIWEGGDRYMYTRHLQITTCGLSFYQMYIGHFTWEEGTRSITLGIPESFTFQYYFGDASGSLFIDFGASNVYADTSEKAIEAGTVRVLEDGRYLFSEEEEFYEYTEHRNGSGLYSFNYQIADYHNGAKKVEPMEMILDLNTMEYAFPDLDA